MIVHLLSAVRTHERFLPVVGALRISILRVVELEIGNIPYEW